MEKMRILFICVHNSARSQMAEAFMKFYAGDICEVMSAGLEAGELNPHVIAVMKEKDIDISHNKTQTVYDLVKKNIMFSYVVTVCDREAHERCPIFPGIAVRLHWPFPDPSSLTGSFDEVCEKTRPIRDMIEEKIKMFAETLRRGEAVKE